MTTPNDDWTGLDTLWRTQAVDAPDLDRLRREAAAGRRRARLLDLLDIGAVLLAALMAWGFAAAAPALTVREIVPLALLGVGALYAIWTVRNRRVPVPDDLAPRALVEAEVQRALAVKRFWRVNTAVMLVLWGSFAAIAGLQAFDLAPVAVPRTSAWWIATAINTPLVLASLLWARRRIRDMRDRLAQLAAVRRQLDA